MLTVPLDHEDLDGPTIEVPVTRAEATDPDNRIGVLLVNPGGPGFPASVLAMFAEQVFTPELRSRFDIIAIDPRGTFPDTAVNCFTDLGDLWSSVDYSPDAPGELEALDAAVQGWVDQCAEDHSDLISHVSTMDAVHDMAALVEALGEEQVSYLGFSYGTVLGSAFVTAYPELVRAAIFDGAYLAYQEPFEAIVDSSEAMEALLVRVFAECDADSGCPIMSGAQEAFVRIAAQADAEPIVGNRFLPTVNEQGFAMVIRSSDVAYGGSADRLLEAVADADASDYFKLQGMLGEAARFLEAGGSAMAINCMDYPYREAVPVPDDAVERLEEITPTLSAVFPTPEGFDPFSMPNECMRWSVGPDLLPQPLSGEGAGPVLVVTATEDPVTPMASAEKLAAELVNGTLLVVDSPVHGSYQVGGPSTARTCATEYMDRFLIDLEIPAEGTSCEEA
jgi:pimeloyl-ACP methyl ester carboxylesterase